MTSKENQECVGLANRLRQNQREQVEDNSPHVIVIARAGTGKTTTLVEGLKALRGYRGQKCPECDEEGIQPNGVTCAHCYGGYLDQPFIPSPQQAAIWKAMEQSKGARSICFVAFNKAIASELQQRVPKGCDAMTMHSMGFKAVREAFGRVRVDNYKVRDIISELLETDIRTGKVLDELNLNHELCRFKPDVLRITEKLVGLCKVNLLGLNWRGQTVPGEVGNTFRNDALYQLAAHYDIDLNGNGPEVFALVPRVLEQCKRVGQGGSVDFADMIWLPVVLGLNVYRYDLLLVDEAQDLNRCQQALALKAGRRLILVGDPKQAIYGFAGADSESMARMEEQLIGCSLCQKRRWAANNLIKPTVEKAVALDILPKPTGEVQVEWGSCEVNCRGCITLPLTVTRRCGKAIVAEAQRYAPDFEAHESCGDGSISSCYLNGNEEGDLLGYRDWVSDGDMVLCRVNAPLVSECFKFLKAGRKAGIQGRDVGQGLISTIRKLMKNPPQIHRFGQPELTGDLPENEVEELVQYLGYWLYTEQRKEDAKRNPSDTRLIALQDRHDCLMCFCEDQTTVDGVVKKIEGIFTDDENSAGIRLSSIHKAKGLEATRVFLLQPKGAGIPHPLAKTPQQREQEMNLFYVAITRAKEELIYVS